jgi:hypothetical protein
MLDIPLRNSQGNRPRLILSIVGWLLIIALGIAGIWWGFFAPPPADEAGEEGEAAAAPTATATAPGGLVPLETEVPGAQPGVTQEPSGDMSPPPSTGGTSNEVFGYGIAADGLPLPDYTMGQVESLGLSWVKQQVRWEDFELTPGQMDWSGYDAVVEAANNHGLRVMLSVVGAPEWTRTYFDSNPEAAPPDDLSLFADFLGRLVDRYQGRIHAIEVWNEQNLDREWDTAAGVEPARYVEMLRLAYQVIKSRDPNIIVISGALSPVGGTATDPNNPSRIGYMDDFQYYQEMIANGFLSYCDCVGVHHNGYNIPPNVAWDDDYQDDTATFRGFWDTPHPSWSFRSTLWRYSDAISGMKPLCITEFGWASSEGLGGYPVGFGFALDNSLDEQAQYATQAFQLMREWGFVRMAFLWNLNYANTGPRTPDDPNAPYSLIDYNGVARPSFDAIRTMEKP